MKTEDRLLRATNQLKKKDKELQTALINTRNVKAHSQKLLLELNKAKKDLEELCLEVASLKEELKKVKTYKPKSKYKTPKKEEES
jgi:hypothetical protein